MSERQFRPQEYVTSRMRKLPTWVLAQYVDHLAMISDEKSTALDDADISIEARIDFYTKVMEHEGSQHIWPALELHRAKVEEQLFAVFGRGHAPVFNQVGTLLAAAHIAHLGFTPAEAMNKDTRDGLASEISQSARKLAGALNKLWAASSPVERGYPSSFRDVDHFATLAKLAEIWTAAESWTQEPRLLSRPSAGDAKRRFFMMSMADWFTELYGQRLDNINALLVSCLYEAIDQATLAKVLDRAIPEK